MRWFVSPAKPLRMAHAIAACVFLGGLALSVAAGYGLQRATHMDANLRFDRQVELIQADVGRRLGQTVYGLRGAAGLYAASKSVDRAAFAAYVASRNLPAEFPGVRGFGFVERVQRGDMDRFVATERLDAAPAFTVRTAGEAPDLYVIKFIEPLADNRPALGFDLGSESVRRQAIEAAVDSGKPVLSGRVVLLQDNRQGPGFLYFLPVYSPGTFPSSPAERRAALRGLVYSPIVVAEVLAGTPDISGGQVEFELFDSEIADPRNLIFNSAGQISLPVQRPVNAAPPAPSFEASRVMVIGGRPLALRVQSSAEFDARLDDRAPWVVGLAGVLLSLLLSLSSWLLATRRARAEALAQGMTGDLDRLARVARRTANTVCITNPQMRITWVNEGFTRTYGYTLEEASGRKPAELLGSGKSDPRSLQRLADALANGRSCRVEVVNRKKDGQVCWIDLDVQPTHDAAGKLTGFMEVGLDISLRKQAEEQLRFSKTFLERAEHISGVGGWAVDLRQRTVQWTDQTCRIYGLAPGFQPAFDEHLKYLDDQSQRNIEQTAAQAIRSRQPWDLELPMTTADGRQIWTRSVGQVEYDGDEPVRLVGALQDITAKKAVEEQLRQANKLLQAVLDNLPCGLSVYDGEMRLIAHNAEYRRLLDLPTSLLEKPGLGFEDIVRHNALRGDYGPGPVDAIVADIVARRRVPVVHQLQRMLASGLVLDVRGAPMPGGGFVTTYTDVTATERDKVALRQSEERLHRALAGSRFALWDLNVKTQTVYLSETWSELLGGPSEPTTASFEQLQALVPAEDLPLVRRAMAPVFKGETESYSVEHRVQRRDGEMLWVHSVGRIAERDEQGMPVRVVGTNRDITERMQAEAELRLARDAADAANRAKTDFLANMSHEIRTPLNGVIGLTRFLLEEPLTVTQRQHAELIDSSAQSLLVLINDFLDFSKIEAGELTLEKVAFDLHDLLGEVSRLHALRAAEKSLGFALSIDANVPPWVCSDPTRVRQILNNLLGNALKFTARGHIGLTVSASADADAGVLLRIAVSDTGIGIAEEAQKRLFARFTQADSSTSRQYGGSGLGLAIVRQLSELLGGRVELQSVPGEGSTFLVFLPVEIADAQPQNTTPDAAENSLSEARILLAEDNPTNQIVAVGVLNRLGYFDVTVASDGQQAVQLALSRPFDAILMDCQMPEMDGYKATQMLRESGCTVPVIAMTANAMKGDREKCLEAGMDDYLTKPVEKQALAAALNACLKSVAIHASGEIPGKVPAKALPLVYDKADVARRFSGDAELLPLAMTSFFEHTPPLMIRLGKAIAQRHFGDIHLCAHTVGGSAATVGAQAMRATANALEQYSLEKNPAFFDELFVRLEKDFHDFQAAVKSSPA